MAKPKKAKRLSSPTSTSGEGGRFESRVQASYLLALLTGDDSRLGGNCRIVELGFQGRIYGYGDVSTAMNYTHVLRRDVPR